jgi:hypothetical protein
MPIRRPVRAGRRAAARALRTLETVMAVGGFIGVAIAGARHGCCDNVVVRRRTSDDFCQYGHRRSRMAALRPRDEWAGQPAWRPPPAGALLQRPWAPARHDAWSQAGHSCRFSYVRTAPARPILGPGVREEASRIQVRMGIQVAQPIPIPCSAAARCLRKRAEGSAI